MEALQKQIGWKRLVRLRWCFGVRALQPESRPQRLSVGLLREVCRRCLYSFRVFVCEAGGTEAQFVAAYDRTGASSTSSASTRGTRGCAWGRRSSSSCAASECDCLA